MWYLRYRNQPKVSLLLIKDGNGHTGDHFKVCAVLVPSLLLFLWGTYLPAVKLGVAFHKSIHKKWARLCVNEPLPQRKPLLLYYECIHPGSLTSCRRSQLVYSTPSSLSLSSLCLAPLSTYSSLQLYAVSQHIHKLYWKWLDLLISYFLMNSLTHVCSNWLFSTCLSPDSTFLSTCTCVFTSKMLLHEDWKSPKGREVGVLCFIQKLSVQCKWTEYTTVLFCSVLKKERCFLFSRLSKSNQLQRLFLDEGQEGLLYSCGATFTFFLTFNNKV